MRSRGNGCNCGASACSSPTRRLYPDYDEYLEKSMVAETTSFFREVLEQNLTLREFLDSDWTMLNERLADHYGIAGVAGRSDAARRAEAGRPSRRIAHAGVDSEPHFRRHAASAGPSRQVGSGIDLWQSAPAAAAQRDGHQAHAAKRAEDHVAGQARSPSRAMPIARPAIARSTRSAWPSTTTTRSAIGAPRRPCVDGSGRESEDRPQRRCCPTAANSPMPSGLKATDARRPR